MNRNMASRRAVLAGAAMLLSGRTMAFAQSAGAAVDGVLASVSPMGDIVVGNADAPVALVQYASASCAFSAKFQRELFPEINRDYIQTGKLKIVFRELPQNNRITAVTLLARCLPRERFFDAYNALFQTQDRWVDVQDPGPAITRIMVGFGMSKETFEKCLADREKAAQLTAYTRNTVRAFGIQATPTFFVDGQKIFGRKEMSVVRAELLSAIDAALKK